MTFHVIILSEKQPRSVEDHYIKMSFQTDTRLSRQKQIHSLAVYHEAVECVSEGAEYRLVNGDTILHFRN